MPDKEITKISAAERELAVPTDVHTFYKQYKYHPQKMQAIINDIATTTISVDKLISSHGLNTKSVYYWRAVSPQLLDAWRAAMRLRTHATAEKFEDDVAKLNDDVENDPDYKKTSNRIRRFDRVWGHRQWFMGRYNRRDFGDKLDIDSNVTVSPAKAREEAYSAFQGVQEADYEEVKLPDINQIEDDKRK